jgi:hypothetical protein
MQMYKRDRTLNEQEDIKYKEFRLDMGYKFINKLIILMSLEILTHIAA